MNYIEDISRLLIEIHKHEVFAKRSKIFSGCRMEHFLKGSKNIDDFSKSAVNTCPATKTFGQSYTDYTPIFLLAKSHEFCQNTL